MGDTYGPVRVATFSSDIKKGIEGQGHSRIDLIAFGLGFHYHVLFSDCCGNS